MHRIDALRRPLWTIVAVSVAVGAICVHFPAPRLVPLLGSSDWDVGPGFYENSRPAPPDVHASIIENSEARFFRSWEPANGSAIGARLESRPFAVPDILVVPYNGYPIEPGVHLAIQCVDSGAEMPVATGNAHEYWVQRFIRVPRTFCAGPIRIVASNSSKLFYIGVGTPFVGSRWHLLKESVFSLVFLHGLVFVLIVLPLIALTSIAVRLRVAPHQAWLGGVALFGFVAYAAFFLVQASKPAAITASFAFYAGCGVLVGTNVWAGGRNRHGLHALNWRIPTLYAFSLFALLFLEMVDVGAGAWNAAYRFKPAVWSSDHIWPRVVADGLWGGVPAPQIFNGWHVSDRPPLMAGVLLLMRPLTAVLGSGTAAAGLSHFMPKAAGIIVNSAVLLIVIEVLGAAGERRRGRFVPVVLLLAFSPMFLFNVIYTWPKMQSAFLALAATLVLARDDGRTERSQILLAGALYGLALLSHAAVALGLLAVPLAVKAMSGRARWKATVAAGLVSIVCWLPWSAWQRYVDPPGNALLKFALTGSFGFDDQQTGVIETARRFSRDLTMERWVEAKQTAIQTILGIGFRVRWIEPYITTDLGVLRQRDFLFVVPSLRFLGLAILVAGLIALGRRDRREQLRPMAWWLMCGAGGIACALLITWTEHIIHAQSYFSLMAVLIAAGYALFSLPRILFVAFSMAQAIYVVVVWGVEPARVHAGINPVTTLAVSAVLLLTVLELRRVRGEVAGRLPGSWTTP